MFAKNLPGLSGVIALVKRYAMRSSFAVALLLLMVMAGLQTLSSLNTSTFTGNAVMQHAKSVPSTGMIGNASTQHLLGHDFGVIVDGSSFDRHLPANAIPFYYTIHNGTIVKRNSELGPLTGTVDSSLTTRGPGHDFGAIVDGSSFDRYLPANAIPFYYTVYNGTIVKRNSELGPLAGTVDNSLTPRGPGHDFGAIEGDK